MSSVQFKIFYGDNFERCKMHGMKKERFELITYQEFACEVLKTVGAFLEGKTPRDVRIQYKDDEDTFVNLNCDEDLVDAFRCLQPVDNSEELYRLSVRVHATATPVQAVNVRTERTIVNEPAKRRCASPTPRKQLHFKEQSTTAEMTKYRSPLQVFLQEKRKAVDNQKRRPVFVFNISLTRGFLFSGRWHEQPKSHHVISVLQTAATQKHHHVTRIFEPQTKTNGP